jgi:hypothetical protein
VGFFQKMEPPGYKIFLKGLSKESQLILLLTDEAGNAFDSQFLTGKISAKPDDHSESVASGLLHVKG